MKKVAPKKAVRAITRPRGIIAVLLTVTLITSLWPLSAYSSLMEDSPQDSLTVSASYDKPIFIDDGSSPIPNNQLFESEIYEAVIDRDYDQKVSLSVSNQGGTDLLFYLAVAGEQPQDLSFGFINEGSSPDSPAYLLPGQSMDIDMTFFAQNATIADRYIPVVLYVYNPETETYEQSAEASLHLAITGLREMQLTLTQGATNSTTLATEYTLTNIGPDSISDLTVGLSGEIADYAKTAPIINNYYLHAGESISFQLIPNLTEVDYSGKEIFEGFITASGLGDKKTFPVSFNISGIPITTLTMGDIALINDDNPFFNMAFDNFRILENQWQEYGDSKTSVGFDILYGINHENTLTVIVDVRLTNLGELVDPSDYDETISLEESDNSFVINCSMLVTQEEYEGFMVNLDENLANAGMEQTPFAESTSDLLPLSNESSFGIDIAIDFSGFLSSMAGNSLASKLFTAFGLGKTAHTIGSDLKNAYCVYNNPKYTSEERRSYITLAATKTMLNVVFNAKSLLFSGIPLIALANGLLGSFLDYKLSQALDNMIPNPCDDPGAHLDDDVEGEQCTNRGSVDTDFNTYLPPWNPDMTDPAWDFGPFSAESDSFVIAADTDLSQTELVIDSQSHVPLQAMATACCSNPNCGAKYGRECKCEGCMNPCAAGNTGTVGTVGTVIQNANGSHRLVPDVYVSERLAPKTTGYSIPTASSTSSGSYTDILNSVTANSGSFKGTGQTFLRAIPVFTSEIVPNATRIVVAGGGGHSGYSVGSETGLVLISGQNHLRRTYSTMPVQYFITTKTHITSMYPLYTPYSLVIDSDESSDFSDIWQLSVLTIKPQGISSSNVVDSSDFSDLPDMRQLPDFSIKPQDIYISNDDWDSGDTIGIPIIGDPVSINFDVFNEGSRSSYCTITAYVDGIEVFRTENDYISQFSSKNYCFEHTPQKITSEVKVIVESTGAVFQERDITNNQAVATLTAREREIPEITKISPEGNVSYLPDYAVVTLKGGSDVIATEFYLDGAMIYSTTRANYSYHANLSSLSLEKEREYELMVKVIYKKDVNTTDTIEKTVTFSFSKQDDKPPVIDERIPTIDEIYPSGHLSSIPTTASAVISNYEYLLWSEFYINGVAMDTGGTSPEPSTNSLASTIYYLNLEAEKEHDLTVIAYYQDNDSPWLVSSVEKTVKFSWSESGRIHEVPSIESISPNGHLSERPTSASAVISNGAEIAKMLFFIDDTFIGDSYETQAKSSVSLGSVVLEANREYKLTIQVFYYAYRDDEYIVTELVEKTTRFSFSDSGQPSTKPVIESISPSGHLSEIPTTASAVISNWEKAAYTNFYLDGKAIGWYSTASPEPSINSLASEIQYLGLEANKEHELTVRVYYQESGNSYPVVADEKTVIFSWGSEEESGASIQPFDDSTNKAVTFNWNTTVFGSTGELKVYALSAGEDAGIDLGAITPEIPVDGIPAENCAYQVTFTKGSFKYTIMGMIAESADAVTIGSSFEGSLAGIDELRYKAGDEISFSAVGLKDGTGNSLCKIEALDADEPVKLSLTLQGTTDTQVIPLEGSSFSMGETINATLPQIKGMYTMRLDLIAPLGREDDEPPPPRPQDPPGSGDKGGTGSGSGKGSGSGNGGNGNNGAGLSNDSAGAGNIGTGTGSSGGIADTGDTHGLQVIMALAILALGTAAELALFLHRRRRIHPIIHAHTRR